MLSERDNELLCRVGRGTPMGDLLRRYWIPALLSAELPEADGAPVRVRLLGEDLVAFRDSNGAIGLLEAGCPHRRAELFFGRNEECGLRCVYHGWKFDTSGRCVDMPSEPAESNFKDKVRVRDYPTHESGGLVWTYMGPPEQQTPFRDFGTEALGREQWQAGKQLSYCNWVQSMEGNLDTSHISWLHSDLQPVEPDDTDRPGYPSQPMSTLIRRLDRAPRLAVHDTPYGFRYAGIRTTPAGHTHVRITDFALPFMTFVSALPVGGSCGMFVPIDDENCWRYQVTVQPFAGSSGRIVPIPERYQTKQTIPGLIERVVQPENDYLIDREAQRTRTFTGIVGIVQQDLAVTESMGAICDRTQEALGASDLAIIRMRQQLLKAAKDLQEGLEPPALDPSYPYHLIRSAEKILAPGEDWRTLGTPSDPVVGQIERGELAFAGRPPRR